MPTVEVIVPDNVIAINGKGYVFSEPFPHEDNLEYLIWHGTPEDGYGRIKFTDDYDIDLWPPLYNEEVAPYVALWQAEHARYMQQQIEREAEQNRRINSPEYRLGQLRFRRQEKLNMYDSVTAQLNRMYRLTDSEEKKAEIDALQLQWDSYAQQLCNLTDNPDSPWDGGQSVGEPYSVPWPEEPPAPKTIQ